MSKTYRVASEAPFRGHDSGAEFEADLTDDEERRAIERGSIELVSGEAAPALDPEAADRRASGEQPDTDEETVDGDTAATNDDPAGDEVESPDGRE